MKKGMFYVLTSFGILLIVGCAATVSKVEMQEPELGKSLLVGAVLVENDGIDDLYQSKTSNINVIVVGRNVEDGKAVEKGYRLKTDKNGYFFLSNVPAGTYILKGIEVDVGYTNRMLISSRWEGQRQIYIQGGYMIDYNVRYWPEPDMGRVIDMGIHYFKLDNAGRIYHDTFPFLHNTILGLKDVVHTMSSPSKYYRDKHPDSLWFQ